MPGLNSILKAWHVMVGRDLHVPWPPGAPGPAPAPVPYVTTALMEGMTPLTARHTTTVSTDGSAPAMVRGTDIGPMIPHIGPPSLTIGLEMLTSGSKSYFGASSVRVRDQWGAPGNLACALLGTANVNLDCGTPMPTPSGMVIAASTHVECLTWGDVVAGVYAMAFDFALQGILNKIGSVAGELMKNGATALAQRIGIGVLGRTVARQLARAAGVRSNIGPSASALRAEAVARLSRIGARVMIYGSSPLGFLVGSPLGPSVSNIRDAGGNQVLPSLVDRGTGEDFADVGGKADDVGSSVDRAIKNYLDHPGVEELGAARAASDARTFR